MTTRTAPLAALLVTVIALSTGPRAQITPQDPEWGDTVAVEIQTPSRNAAQWTVGLRSFGPVQYGMTVAQAEAASGSHIRVRVSEASESGDCGSATITSAPAFIEFMVSREREWRIMGVTVRGSSDGGRVSSAGRPVTRSGVGVGSTFAQVRRTYPGQIRTVPELYGGPSRLAFVPRAQDDRDFVVLFGTQDGRVVSEVSAGYRGWADAPEGCS